MSSQKLDTHHKALTLNLDPSTFGSFAEIGAGQELARWFLRVGRASGTVAKTISAYDKKVSDDLYGSGSRYVSKQRLEAMLDNEWTQPTRCVARRLSDIFSPIFLPATFLSPCKFLLGPKSVKVGRPKGDDHTRPVDAPAVKGLRLVTSSPGVYQWSEVAVVSSA
jgi:hypothetical protein